MGMLSFIEKKLMPAMEPFGFHNPVAPIDLVFGLSGCHSSFLKRYKDVAADTGEAIMPMLVEDIRLFLNGESPKFVVNRQFLAK